jgi:hypothetical protein
MTSPELAAKVMQLSAGEVAQALGILRDRQVVVIHQVRPPDPHFPPISAVALVDESRDGAEAVADANHRAQECAQVLQRQLLRSHRCL